MARPPRRKFPRAAAVTLTTFAAAGDSADGPSVELAAHRRVHVHLGLQGRGRRMRPAERGRLVCCFSTAVSAHDTHDTIQTTHNHHAHDTDDAHETHDHDTHDTHASDLLLQTMENPELDAREHFSREANLQPHSRVLAPSPAQRNTSDRRCHQATAAGYQSNRAATLT